MIGTEGAFVATSATLDVAVATGTVLTGGAAISATLIGALLDSLTLTGAFHGSTVLLAVSPKETTFAVVSLTDAVLTGNVFWLGISRAVVHEQSISMLQVQLRHCAQITFFNHNVLLHVRRQEEAGVRRQSIGFLHDHVQLSNLTAS